MSFTIIGTGSAAPGCVKTNDDLTRLVDTTDEWIVTRTGIRERRICTTETLTDLGCAAAVRALENAGVAVEELDLILCHSLQGDYITPSLSCMLQERLGAACPALDLNAACSGFLYALDVAAGYFARKRVKKVLIVAAECLSKFVDWSDRSTCVLFGDGAGAVVLAEGEDLLSIHLSAKGAVLPLHIEGMKGDCPFAGKKQPAQSRLVMDGPEIYKFAVSSMCRDLALVMEEAGLSGEDVDFVLPHQANSRIIDAAQNKLPIAREKYLVNIERYGNTSAASIPLLLDEKNRAGCFKKGDILALAAFGAGLTTGAAILRWNQQPFSLRGE